MNEPQRISIVQGDITQSVVDAIVNAANSSLLGGGGVDGAIHRAAGPQLLEECRQLGGCPPGQARITRGYRLPAGHVIHTVGPVYARAGAQAPKLLASCYHSCLELAAKHGIKTIAFPAISCGVYGYPIEEACAIAFEQVLGGLRENHDLRVVFVLFSEQDRKVYDRHLQELMERMSKPC
jgi:O-acetyl-ADP-ribose deacetylase